MEVAEQQIIDPCYTEQTQAGVVVKRQKKCIYLTLSEGQYNALCNAVEQMATLSEEDLREKATWHRLWEHLHNRRRERMVDENSKTC